MNFIFKVVAIVWGLGMIGFPILAQGKEADKRYFVQLNAFKSSANAQKFARSLAARGYDVFVITGKSREFYKVRLGPYDTWKSARLAASQLKRKENLAPLVLASLDGEKAFSLVRFQGRTLPPETGPPRNPVFIRDPDEPDTRPVEETLSPEQIRKSKAEGVKPVEDSLEMSDSVDRVMGLFLSWKEAWELRNVERYLSFYSKSFDASPETRKHWKGKRISALKRHSGIRVDVSEVQIDQIGGRIEMRFVQEFESNEFKDTGHKSLEWVLEEGTWKIIREIWHPA